MNKIIVTLDPLKYNAETAAYAVELAKRNAAHLVGVFLEDFSYHTYNLYQMAGGRKTDYAEQSIFEEKDLIARQKAVEEFVHECSNKGIRYSVHHDRNIAVKELIRESLYADLLIVNNEETVIHYSENPPTTFVRALLTDAQCPVLVVPQSPTIPKSLVYLYDGSPASVFAMRCFSHLLPAVVDLPLEVVTVNALPPIVASGKRLLAEMLSDHFPNVTYTGLKGNAEAEITDYLKRKKETLVILGAYSRSTLSRWYRRSMADLLMEELSLPLFIAHN